MKKGIVSVLLSAMLLVLVACGGNNAEQKAPESETQTENAVQTDATLSPVVQNLYQEFDEALESQIGPKPENYSDIKVGAVIISMTNPFWANMKECYEDAAEGMEGVTLDVQTGTTEGDTASQLDVLMAMADMDYDVIIVSPIDGTNLIPGIIKCNENGIKVINLGPGVDVKALEEAGGHLDAKITVKFEDQGKIVAEDMMSRMPEGGEVAILSGLAGAAQSEGRTKGAQDTFAEDDKFKLVNVVNCDWEASLAYDATKDLLVAHPDLKGIFACNDVMALAAAEALQAENVDDVYVYGIDFTEETRNAIKDGEMTGSMSYSSARYTAAALQMAIMLNEGEEIDGPVYLPLTLANTENVNELDGWK